jgi:hypothetical protein
MPVPGTRFSPSSLYAARFDIGKLILKSMARCAMARISLGTLKVGMLTPVMIYFYRGYIMAKHNKRVRKRRTKTENRVISMTVQRLESDGLSEDRATAAAFRMFREKELLIPKPPPKLVSSRTLSARQRKRQVDAARRGAALLRKYLRGG